MWSRRARCLVGHGHAEAGIVQQLDPVRRLGHREPDHASQRSTVTTPSRNSTQRTTTHLSFQSGAAAASRPRARRPCRTARRSCLQRCMHWPQCTGRTFLVAQRQIREAPLDALVLVEERRRRGAAAGRVWPTLGSSQRKYLAAGGRSSLGVMRDREERARYMIRTGGSGINECAMV